MRKNRQISWILTVAFIFSIIFSLPAVPVVAGCQDISGHWAESQIEYLMSQNIINGYPDNTFRPENPISRAEFIVITNKAFNFSDSAAINYSDIKPTDWFAADIARAKAAGYISGYEDGTMKPNQQISRQEAASIVARILSLQPVDTIATLQKFSDGKTIATWSQDAIAAMVENGYLKGYPDNTFKPTNSIKRAEAAVLFKIVLDSERDAFKVEPKPEPEKVQSLFDKAGTYGPETGTQTINENVTISASGVILQNIIIEKDLIIAEEVGDGDVTLNNVTVKGKTYVRGGGKDSIHIKGGQYSEIIIEKTATGQVRIVAVDTSGLRVTISENAKGEKIILNGDIKTVIVKADDVKITTQGDANIGELKVESGLKDVNIELAKDSTVKEIVLNSKTTVEGEGAPAKASGSKVNESSFATPPGSITESSTGGSRKSSSSSKTVAVSAISVTPESITLLVGQEVKITATVEPSNATNKKVNWTTSDANVATVANGVVTAKAAGTATITATSDANSAKKDSCVVTVVKPIAAKFESTGSVGIAPDTAGEAAGKIYAEYKLVAGEGDAAKDIFLAEDNVARIDVKVGEGEWKELTANTDKTLWFNVEAETGSHVFWIVTKEQVDKYEAYMAVLNWDKEIKTATWEATDREGEHEGVTYVEYQLLDDTTSVSLKEGEVKLIASKDDAGKWVALEPNTDATLWFNKAKATGNYDFFVVTSEGVMYKAILDWILPLASINWLEQQIAIEGAARPTALHDGTNYHLWYVESGTIKHKTGLTPVTLAGASGEQCTSGGEAIVTSTFGDNPFVIQEGSTYYMFIANSAGDAINVYSSTDGLAWTADADNTVLSKGSDGAWDADKIDNPMVTKDGTEYKLYYQARNNDKEYKIGLATSATINGTYQKSDSNPVLEKSTNGWDSYRVFQPWVVKDGDYYYMWYASTSSGGPAAIGYAYSVDGINWTKASDNPIIKAEGATDKLPTAVPAVVKVNDNWHMWYLCGKNINYVSTIKDDTTVVTDASSLTSSLETGGIIVLGNDISLSSTASIAKDVTIIGNGKTISGAFFNVTSGKAIFENIKFQGSGSSGSQDAIQVRSGASATVKGCEFNGFCRGINAYFGSTITIQNNNFADVYRCIIAGMGPAGATNVSVTDICGNTFNLGFQVGTKWARGVSYNTDSVQGKGPLSEAVSHMLTNNTFTGDSNVDLDHQVRFYSGYQNYVNQPITGATGDNVTVVNGTASEVIPSDDQREMVLGKITVGVSDMNVTALTEKLTKAEFVESITVKDSSGNTKTDGTIVDNDRVYIKSKDGKDTNYYIVKVENAEANGDAVQGTNVLMLQAPIMNTEDSVAEEPLEIESEGLAEEVAESDEVTADAVAENEVNEEEVETIATEEPVSEPEVEDEEETA